jgi:MFS family permease
MFLFLTYYFQLNLGYSALKSGLALLPFSGGIIVSAGVVAQLLPRLGPKPLMIVGLVMAVLGMLWLTQVTAETSYVTHILPSELLLSIGLAGVFIPASSTALVGVDPHDAGVASALLNTSQQIGGSLGTALLNTLYASAVTAFLTANVTKPSDLQRLQPDAFIHGYHVAFFWGAVLLAAALVTAIVLINAKKDDIPAPDEPAALAAV